MNMTTQSTLRKRLKANAGQSTVEAALFIPLLFLLILVLCQPMILLYNHMIMNSAASESCRLLSTMTHAGRHSEERYEGYIKRRLAAIPPIDIFHAHTGEKTWDITMEGNEYSPEVTVRIVNRLKPLPLVGWGTQLLGLCDEDGYIVQTVEVTMPTQPDWVWNNSTGGPPEWTTQW